MPLTEPLAGRQTGGPVPLTITDLQCHASRVGGKVWKRCESAVLRQFLDCKRCESCKSRGVTINTGCRPICWCGPFVGSDVAFTEWSG